MKIGKNTQASDIPATLAFDTPEDRVLRLVVSAIDKNPDNRGAIRAHIFGAVRHDLPLLWAMTKEWHGQAADSWIARGYEARARNLEKNKQIAKGRSVAETQNIRAPRNGGGSASPVHMTAGKADTKIAGGQLRGETHSIPATSKGGSHRASPTPMTAGDRRAKFGLAAREYAIRTVSKLDTFLVNGQPIGDCTPDEVRAWLASQTRNVRFAEMLIANLPPNRPIRDFIKPAEADAAYERAGNE